MKIKWIFSILVLLFCGLAFLGCSSDGSSDSSGGVVPDVVSYTVTFNEQGGTSVTAQTIPSGDVVIEPAAQTRTFYTFGGWYKEAECTNAWIFATDTVTADTTLYAKWTVNSWINYSGTPLQKDGTTAGAFYDVKATSSGDVYVAGLFENHQGQSIRSVAKLSGTTWSQVGSGLYQDSEVCTIYVNGTAVYIGGDFGLVGGASGPIVFAKLDTADNTWKNVVTTSAKSSDFDGGTAAGENYQKISTIFGDSSGNVCVVGQFGRAGITEVNSVAKLSGTTWSGFGLGFQEDGGVMFPGQFPPAAMTFQGFTEDGTGFFVSGNCVKIDGDSISLSQGQKAIWSGTDWAKDSTYYNFGHFAHYKTDGTLYLKGVNEGDPEAAYLPVFSTDGTTYTNYNGTYTGTASGRMIFAPDGTPYVIGIFTHIKTNYMGVETVVAANGFAKYNGTAWEALSAFPDTVGRVTKIIFTPAGDMWVIASAAGTEWGNPHGELLFKMPK